MQALSSLKKLLLDQLKINQGFARDISIDPDDTAIRQAITAMANNLTILASIQLLCPRGMKNGKAH
jgi:EAL domain-containing protein (putative c-di-GMP-specific phosphodiesterase class I)